MVPQTSCLSCRSLVDCGYLIIGKSLRSRNLLNNSTLFGSRLQLALRIARWYEWVVAVETQLLQHPRLIFVVVNSLLNNKFNEVARYLIG